MAVAAGNDGLPDGPGPDERRTAASRRERRRRARRRGARRRAGRLSRSPGPRIAGRDHAGRRTQRRVGLRRPPRKLLGQEAEAEPDHRQDGVERHLHPRRRRPGESQAGLAHPQRRRSQLARRVGGLRLPVRRLGPRLPDSQLGDPDRRRNGQGPEVPDLRHHRSRHQPGGDLAGGGDHRHAAQFVRPRVRRPVHPARAQGLVVARDRLLLRGLRRAGLPQRGGADLRPRRTRRRRASSAARGCPGSRTASPATRASTRTTRSWTRPPSASTSATATPAGRPRRSTSRTPPSRRWPGRST